MKNTIGIVVLLSSLLLGFPALADESASPAEHSTPSTLTNPQPPSGGKMNNTPQHHDIRDDAQNYREAQNEEERHRTEMKAQREHRQKDWSEQHGKKAAEGMGNSYPGKTHANQ